MVNSASGFPRPGEAPRSRVQVAGARVATLRDYYLDALKAAKAAQEALAEAEREWQAACAERDNPGWREG